MNIELKQLAKDLALIPGFAEVVPWRLLYDQIADSLFVSDQHRVLGEEYVGPVLISPLIPHDMSVDAVLRRMRVRSNYTGFQSDISGGTKLNGDYYYLPGQRICRANNQTPIDKLRAVREVGFRAFGLGDHCMSLEEQRNPYLACWRNGMKEKGC